MQWIQVHAGPIWQVQLYQGRLDAEGIRTFIPDESTKVVDPFVTGGAALMTELMVVGEDAERARGIIESIKDEGPLTPDADDDPMWDDESVEETPDEASDEDEEKSPQAETEWFATRTRWGAVIWITFPFAVVTGFFYLHLCKKHGTRSISHGLTIAALVFAVLNLVVVTVLVLLGVLWPAFPMT